MKNSCKKYQNIVTSFQNFQKIGNYAGKACTKAKMKSCGKVRIREKIVLSASIRIPAGCFCGQKDAPSHKTKRTPPIRVVFFFGARDGTRTHTALTTRTSNVLVYHSNTLASAPQYYTAAGTFCQYNFSLSGARNVKAFPSPEAEVAGLQPPGIR